jgi:hypothetical protein
MDMPTDMLGDYIKINTARWGFGKTRSLGVKCRCIIMARFLRGKREFGKDGVTQWILKHKHLKR